MGTRRFRSFPQDEQVVTLIKIAYLMKYLSPAYELQCPRCGNTMKIEEWKDSERFSLENVDPTEDIATSIVQILSASLPEFIPYYLVWKLSHSIGKLFHSIRIYEVNIVGVGFDIPSQTASEENHILCTECSYQDEHYPIRNIKDLELTAITVGPGREDLAGDLSQYSGKKVREVIKFENGN